MELSRSEQERIRTLRHSVIGLQGHIQQVVVGLQSLAAALNDVLRLPVIERLCEMEKKAEQQKAEVERQRAQLKSHMDRLARAFPFLA